MIVKVQTSIETTADCEQVLVYSRDRSVRWEGPLPSLIKRLMQGRKKAYFEAEVVNCQIVLSTDIPDQDW